MERMEAAVSSGSNGVPSMFNAGISNKFTKRHVGNFRDTTLTAASAAKARAEKKLERQAEAIDKQQKKIEDEMRKVEELALRLHRQQVREAKRLRDRVEFAATIIQRTVRERMVRVNARKWEAAICIQRLWRGALARQYCLDLHLELLAEEEEVAASVIARSTRLFLCRRARRRTLRARDGAAVAIQRAVRESIARRKVSIVREERLRRESAAVVIQATARAFVTRLIYLDVLFLICRMQAVARGFLVRRWLRQQLQLAAAESAVAKFQAHVRGFCVRKRIQQQETKEEPRTALAAAVSHSMMHRKGPAQQEEYASRIDAPTKKTMPFRASAPKPTPKRSYWLPAGASFNKRLPVVLPPATSGTAARSGQLSSPDADVVSDKTELVRCFPKQVPRGRRHARPRPGRLSPVKKGGTNSPNSHAHAVDKVANEVIVEALRLEREEEARRQAERALFLQKQKEVQERNARRERRRLELEAQSRREVEEREESERAVMEREDRAMRLYVKLLQRRTREGRVRRQSAEQQREERERIAMAREERQTRLRLKRRRAHPRQPDEASTTLGAKSSSSSQSSLFHASSVASSVSSSIQSKPRVRTSNKAKNLGEHAHCHQLRDAHASSSPSPTRKRSEQLVRTREVQHDAADTWQARLKAKLSVPNGDSGDSDDGVDYGEEFEDMVDELHLAVR